MYDVLIKLDALARLVVLLAEQVPHGCGVTGLWLLLYGGKELLVKYVEPLELAASMKDASEEMV